MHKSADVEVTRMFISTVYIQHVIRDPQSIFMQGIMCSEASLWGKEHLNLDPSAGGTLTIF